MNDPAFKTAAHAIAEAAPRHLDQPTTPPIRWRLEGANLVVVLADGRIATGPCVIARSVLRDEAISPPTPPVKKQAIVPGSSEVVPVPARGTGVEAPVASLPAKVVAPIPVRKPPSSSPKRKTR